MAALIESLLNTDWGVILLGVFLLITVLIACTSSKPKI